MQGVAQDVFTVSLDPGTGSCAVVQLVEQECQGGVVLPLAIPSTACACNGYSFRGWATHPVDDTTARPALYEAGKAFYPSSDTTLFAVYAQESHEGWKDVTTVADFVEGEYAIANKNGSKTFYLPCSGPTTHPPIPRMTFNSEGEPVTAPYGNQPIAPSNLWTIAKLNETQYSISYQRDGVTYYLKAFADTNYGLQVTTYAPSSGWEISQDSNHGLLLRFPAWEPDPAKAVRYLCKTYESWATLTFYTSNGNLHLYKSPPVTYSTHPDCHCDQFEQEVTLAEGWNWWTPAVQCTLTQLEEALVDQGMSIQSFEASVSYDGEQWEGTLDTIVVGQLYRIQLSDPCDFNLIGAIPDSVTVTPTIVPGFNWIGFKGIEPVSIADLFGVATSVVGDKVISQDEGFAIFNGTAWEGTLTTIRPGRGYVYWR